MNDACIPMDTPRQRMRNGHVYNPNHRIPDGASRVSKNIKKRKRRDAEVRCRSKT